jgi:hypothetical protein
MGYFTDLLKKRWYPWSLQVVTLVIFTAVIAQLVFGSRNEGENPGSIIVWLLWWPLIPLTFLLAGRFWCAICPFGTAGDWARKFLGLNRPVPRVIRQHGLWIINGLFFVIAWYDVVFGLTTSVSATAGLLLLVLAATIAMSLVYEKRAWCRYMCPLGGMFGNYSQTATVELRGTPEICGSCRDLHCYKGRDDIPGCPLFISLNKLESNRTCNFCGECVKSCQKDSPRMVTRERVGHELWRKSKPRFDEAFFAASLMGLIALSTLGMLDIRPAALDRPVGISLSHAHSYIFLATASLLVILAAAILIYAIGAAFSARLAQDSFIGNFTRFGYALIPLNLATHFAHNLDHFLGEGKLIAQGAVELFLPTTVAVAAPGAEAAGHGGHGADVALISAAYIQAFQFGLVGLGTLLSFYVARRIALANGYSETVSWPHYAVIAVFSFISFWLFSLPMSGRH